MRIPRFWHMAFSLAGLLASRAHADFVTHSWQSFQETQGVRVGIESMAYTTGQNFDSLGNVTIPTGLNSLFRSQNDLNIALAATERLTFFGRLSWAYIFQSSSLRPGSGFGFTDQTLGTSFRFFKSSLGSLKQGRQWTLDLQLQSDFPAYSNSTADASATPYLGDGSTDLSLGVFFTLPFHGEREDGASLRIGSGYTYRTQGFSATLPWSASLFYSSFNYGVTGLLGMSGAASLYSDTVASSLTPRSSTGSGGSLITGATNPTWIQIHAKIGYQTNPSTEFGLSMSQSLWGQSAPSGLNLSLLFQKRFGVKNLSPLVQSEGEYGKSNRGFVNYSLDAKVLKSDQRLKLVKINKGSQDGIEVGQIFDIFAVQKNGVIGTAVSRGESSNVSPNDTSLVITERYQDISIEEGFIAKRLVQ